MNLVCLFVKICFDSCADVDDLGLGLSLYRDKNLSSCYE